MKKNEQNIFLKFRLNLFETLILILLFFFPQIVSAQNVSFGQKILPMDCIFTVVNAGTGQLDYLTPQACGVYVPPISTPTIPVQSPNPATQVISINANPNPSPYVRISHGITELNPSGYNPDLTALINQPLKVANPKNLTCSSTSSIDLDGLYTFIGILGIIALVVFIYFNYKRYKESVVR